MDEEVAIAFIMKVRAHCRFDMPFELHDGEHVGLVVHGDKVILSDELYDEEFSGHCPSDRSNNFFTPGDWNVAKISSTVVPLADPDALSKSVKLFDDWVESYLKVRLKEIMTEVNYINNLLEKEPA